MITLGRTNSENQDFTTLVGLLDMDLAERDGKDHSFYAQYNKIHMIKHAVVAYEEGKPVSCGAIKQYDSSSMEVKRMFTLPACRGRGFAAIVLKELEQWALELSYQRCILETGLKQPEAIKLYEKNGYTRIPNYGQYAGIENSVCFEKQLLQRTSVPPVQERGFS
jgi:putative acetyltransferase